MATSERGCCVPRCGKTRKDDTILHSFPNPALDMDRYLTWIQATGIDSSLDPHYVYKNRRVCHDHFEQKFLTWTRRLSPGAVPTLLLPGSQEARVPLVDISNIPVSHLLDAQSTSISTGSQMSRDEMTNHPLSLLSQAPSTSMSRGQLGAQRATQPKPKLETGFDGKSLIKAISKLKIQKKRYALRLKKALQLAENRTFKNALKKFTTLGAMFTLMQFRLTSKKKMGHRFTESEKIMALSLFKRSPRAYKWLQKFFVLPSSMTLSRLIAWANIKPGMNENLFQQLKERVKNMKDDHKLCILLFDEMSIAPHFDYNQRRDEISGFVNNGKSRELKVADHALVFLIRGVQKNFKQPLYFTFCAGSTKTTELAVQIKEIIRKLHNIGLRVLATICDQGTSNVSAIHSLIKETKRKYLQRNEELRRDIFEVDDKEVIPLYDPPHLIKGMRNNLLSKNLICTINGSTKIGKWEHLVKLHEEDPAYKEIRLVPKLTAIHINPDTFQKMKVKYATQVFSQKVAITMGFLAERKILPAECTQTADIILFFDELFDSLNGSLDNSKKRSGKELLYPVTPKSKHHSIWSNAKFIFNTMKFIAQDKQITVPTINNWLQTINNVEYLIQKLFNEYNLKSVWMRHFNQDPLENFFGAIRSHGCRNTNPTVAGFESSFAALLINNLSGQHSRGSNCEEDSCQTMFTSLASFFKNIQPEPIHTDNIITDIDETIYVELNQKINDPRILATLQYVTGYLLKKIKINVFKNCRICKDSFYDKNNACDYLKVREYTKGKFYLTYPNKNLVQLFSKIQDIITYIIKNQCIVPNIKTYIKTLLYTELDFDIFDCENHKPEIIKHVVELSCIFFLCNWCRDVNKILNGTRLDVDINDVVKMYALEYVNKRKHNKSRYR